MLDSKIKLIRDHFGIHSLSDWSFVDPRDILALDGIGPVTLDHCRLYLASKGVSLKNDRTPEYWIEHLGQAKAIQQMANHDDQVLCPFTILVDTAEQQPFAFAGMRADADQQHRLMIVKTEWRALGRHPDSLGDYSIDGLVGDVAVERKSVEDLQGTLLSFGDRRERFERELENLSQCDRAAVVVEGSLLKCLEVEERGRKSKQTNAKCMFRSIIALQQDHAVSWFFCDTRRLAETVAFRFMYRFWKKQHDKRKESERLLGTL